MHAITIAIACIMYAVLLLGDGMLLLLHPNGSVPLHRYTGVRRLLGSDLVTRSGDRAVLE